MQLEVSLEHSKVEAKVSVGWLLIRKDKCHRVGKCLCGESVWLFGSGCGSLLSYDVDSIHGSHTSKAQGEVAEAKLAELRGWITFSSDCSCVRKDSVGEMKSDMSLGIQSRVIQVTPQKQRCSAFDSSNTRQV
jgi:hypothetical protein